MATVSHAYPAHRQAHVVLRDGAVVELRPVRPEDRDAIATLLTTLSPDARLHRFFSQATDLEREATRAVDVDQRSRYGLVAVARDGRIVAHAAYFADESGRAEVAWTVAEDHRGRGLGTLLLAHLAERAEELGIGPFVAYVMPDNKEMIEVLKESGVPLRISRAHDQVTFEFPTSLSPNARDRFEIREAVATAASVRTVLEPRSIAVIGASRTRGTIGGEVFHNLIATGFTGPVYPVNSRAPVVQSVIAYPTIADAPGAVDLAVIVVPAAHVLAAARECAAKGVRALVVISAGFGETGPEGLAQQRELVEICRAAGMRLIGPNCMGVLNTAPDIRMDATFAPTFPPAGRIGFLSQSGALGLAIIDQCRERGIGLSSFVSVGNKADISGNDLLQYWEADPRTDLVLLYLESFGNPRKFARIARRVGRSKPILVVKSGRSVAGARATSSHTGALVAASDVTVDALFAQTGVVRTDTLAELLDAASLFASQPLPAGKRVAILTNAGGPAILCADALEARGLEVPPLAATTQAALRTMLAPEAAVANPVDMIASASPEQYERAIVALAADPGVDAIVAIFIPPLTTPLEEVARAIASASGALPRPVPLLAVLMSEDRAESVMAAARVPTYPYPEDAARALAHAVRHAAWRALPNEEPVPIADVHPEEPARVAAAAVAEGRGWLEPEEVALVLRAYGLPLAPFLVVRTPEEAGTAAATLGDNVAVKGIAAGLLHKTEARAVRIGLRGRDAVVAAANEMREDVARAGHRIDRFLVQAMAQPGTEMLVGMVYDPSFGPVIACGAGGTGVELLKDVSVRVAPLTPRDARDMVRGLRTYPLLDGYRGREKADVAALEDVILRMSALVESCPEIAEIDLNPVIVGPHGATIVDARIRVAAAAPSVPFAALRR